MRKFPKYSSVFKIRNVLNFFIIIPNMLFTPNWAGKFKVVPTSNSTLNYQG